MHDLERRRQAAQAAVDRFKGRSLEYGRDDCVRMAALVLRRMGHVPPLAKAGTYRSALGATRALRRLGVDTLAAALDGTGLARIAPAAALVADIVMLPAEGPFDGALTIAVGNGRVLGWHESVGTAEILHPLQFVGAWRL